MSSHNKQNELFLAHKLCILGSENKEKHENICSVNEISINKVYFLDNVF